jgi:3-hydroxyisobutyrate dehydrogenase-like beta-hydroxyacid dehydrogenase
VVVGIVSPGAMGSGLARSLHTGGARVVTTVDGRSERTLRLAGEAQAELLSSLDDVVSAADVVLSVVPPGEAAVVAAAIAEAAQRVGATPLVADVNAISPATATAVEQIVAHAGLDLVDGSISGPPPREGRETRIYLSGARADEVAALDGPGIVWRTVGPRVGAASAVKMSTASVYKGTSALLAQALVSARENGVLEHVVEDLRRSWPELVDDASPWLQSAAAKAHRYVAEMEQIAATQDAAGLTPSLFEAMAEIYRHIATTPLSRRAPEEVDRALSLEDAVDGLRADI